MFSSFRNFRPPAVPEIMLTITCWLYFFVVEGLGRGARSHFSFFASSTPATDPLGPSEAWREMTMGLWVSDPLSVAREAIFDVQGSEDLVAVRRWFFFFFLLGLIFYMSVRFFLRKTKVV